ncbi:MAG TPA: BlaI/MecI/CopY family transcriptional regulator [Verrucomicrobiae bacterium]|jgi:predicted transcriptional regulator|nr:BlaI/MecI/CopY family transcriptional regulator [Verrucomicrobiae bacterium]
MKKGNRLHKLGDLQLRILQLLWEHGELAAAAVHAALQPERPLAPTTVATMLAKMQAKGLVAHRQQGRAFIYRAAVDAGEVTRGLGDYFVRRLFAGSVSGAVMHLVRTSEVSRQELDQLEKLIQEQKRRAK